MAETSVLYISSEKSLGPFLNISTKIVSMGHVRFINDNLSDD